MHSRGGYRECGMGQVWLPAGEVLVCSPSWYHSGYGFEKLHAASEQLDYQSGEGLPGLAWATGKPQLLADVRDAERFDRAAQAQRAGVREAMAVPVMGAAGAVAVLELFVTHERAGEPGRLERIAKVRGRGQLEKDPPVRPAAMRRPGRGWSAGAAARARPAAGRLRQG